MNSKQTFLLLYPTVTLRVLLVVALGFNPFVTAILVFDKPFVAAKLVIDKPSVTDVFVLGNLSVEGPLIFTNLLVSTVVSCHDSVELVFGNQSEAGSGKCDALLIGAVLVIISVVDLEEYGRMVVVEALRGSKLILEISEEARLTSSKESNTSYDARLMQAATLMPMSDGRSVEEVVER